MRLQTKILFLFIVIIKIIFANTNKPVLSGLDVIAEDNYKLFANKNIGIICNHTSVDKNGKHIVDVLHSKCNVKAIFAPEHGFRGEKAAGAKILNGKDIKTGIDILSLYGKIKKPTKEMLKDIDILVYDIQDVGVRFYTYISTMAYCMEAAAQFNLDFIVLDRPNPIRGDIVEGPSLGLQYKSFVGMFAIPIRYGLTVGEFASYINEEHLLQDSLKTNLQIIKMKNWKRSSWYDETGMKWIAPSPNIPNLETAIVYPGMCFLEGTNLSEGRGTDTPFLLFGAPWLNNRKIVNILTTSELKGETYTIEDFTPKGLKGKAYNPKFEGQLCKGIRIKVINRDSYNAIESVAKILDLIHKEHPGNFKWREHFIDLLSGNIEFRTSINNNKLDTFIKTWKQTESKFKKESQKYYIY